MANLYNLSDEFVQLSGMLESCETEEDFEAVQNSLLSLKGEAGDIIEQACMVIQESNANANKIQAEIERLLTRKKHHAERVARMRDAIKALMVKADLKKVVGVLFSVTLAEGSESVDVFDLDLIPDEFIEVKTVLQPDKAMIKKTIKAGQEVAGAAVVRGDKQLRIK